MSRVKLSDLMVATADSEIQVGGLKLAFQYYAMWRERFTEEERQSHVGLTNREYMKIWLPRNVISWDLVDDDGHAVPVTADAIEQHAIPDTLLLAIYGRALSSNLAGKALT